MLRHFDATLVLVPGRSLRTLAAAAFAVATLAGGAGAQCTEISSFASNDKTFDQIFSQSMAESGDRLVIGAPYDTTKGTSAGAAYVFEWDSTALTWVQKQELFASDAAAGDLFGWSVTIEGDVLVVGAEDADTTLGVNAGAAYVFRRDPATDSWNEEQKLVPSTGGVGYLFGGSVAISGSVVVVGAPYAFALGGYSGDAFVFRDTGGSPRWVEEKELLDANGAPSEFAGTAVATDGVNAFVGAPGGVGLVTTWTYNGSQWTQGPDLLAHDGAWPDAFGSTLALDGDGLLVGAPYHTVGTQADLGAGYVFRDGAAGWSEEVELFPPGFGAGGYWGWSVAMRDDVVVLASPWVSDGVTYTCGAGYVFRRLSGVWYSDHAVFASDRFQNDTFGRTAAFTSHDFLIGAPLDGSSSGVNDFAGRIYRFNRDEIVTLIEPPQPPPASTVKFRTLCGDPGNAVMLVLTSVDNAPKFLVLLVAAFQSDDALTIQGTTPSPSLGVHLGFTSFKIGVKGNVVQSAEAFVDL